MRVLVLGGSGMLGHKLVECCSSRFETWCTLRSKIGRYERFGIFRGSNTIGEVDATEIATVSRSIDAVRPDVVINAIGIVKQKQDSAGVASMIKVNSLLPHDLASIGKERGFRMITISTDCVFSGRRGNYSEADPTDAADSYGQSKHLGEVDKPNCLTLRTSLIGRELETAQGLVEWFIRKRGSTVKGYSRAIFSGFPTAVFADIIGDIIENHPALSGVFHVSSEPISKLDLLAKINSTLGLGITLNDSSDVVIDRSIDSSRFRRITGFEPSSWDSMIETFSADSKKYDK